MKINIDKYELTEIYIENNNRGVLEGMIKQYEKNGFESSTLDYKEDTVIINNEKRILWFSTLVKKVRI